jgi:DNA-binding transcriptional LysR family regulator
MIAKPADLPPALLRSFLAVADLRSFSEAARRLALRQSTVSQHVQRLEHAVGRRLLLRDTHAVALTPEGEAMRDLAVKSLAAQDSIARYFAGTAGRERLRLGISEDFAAAHLVALLSTFQREHPNVDLELMVGLSDALYSRYDAGELDVMFAKRRTGDRRGAAAWRERLVWIARPGYRIEPTAPVALIAFSAPSVTRSLAIAALERSGRTWRLACSSGSLNGLRAAALAGLGAAAHSLRLIPQGLAPLNDAALPLLDEVEFVALGPGGRHAAANALVAALVAEHP